MEFQCLVAKSEDFGAIGTPRTQMVPPGAQAAPVVDRCVKGTCEIKQTNEFPTGCKTEYQHFMKDGLNRGCA